MEWGKKQTNNNAGALCQEEEKQLQSLAKEAQSKNTSEKKEFHFSIAEVDAMEKELRKPRSRAYMEIFDVIDILSSTDEEIIAELQSKMDEEMAEEFSEMTVEEILEEIRATFREEFENMEVKIESVLQGILSKCYIDGCDCHAISPEGYILDHYKIGGDIPEELEKGRIVYHRYPNCRSIEVYTDCCRVVDMDSTVTRIPNSEI